jgi:hypothetical protein
MSSNIYYIIVMAHLTVENHEMLSLMLRSFEKKF